jgi:hypothetical protein
MGAPFRPEAPGLVRIASPVITSGPILGTLAELADKGGRDVAGVVDGPQVETVFRQWAQAGHTAWKIPLLDTTLSKLPFSAKPSGEENAESVLEIHDASIAERLAKFVDEVRGRYPAAEIPERSRDMTSSTPSASSA